MPMREWRTVYILACQCPVYALFAGERFWAGHLSQNWLRSSDTSNGCGGEKEASTAYHD
jgi:hypothetical protein